MTTLEQTKIRGPFTFADLADAPDDGLRREIIGGQLHVSPAPVIRHQLVLIRLARVLDDARPRDLIVLPAPLDWRYDDNDVVEPDIVVFHESDMDLEGPLRAPAIPVLLVEILSPSNRSYDRLLKRDLYERLGVAHYWLVDPGGPDRDPATEALTRNEAGTYETDRTATGSDTFATEQPFPIRFTPTDLLRR